MSVKIKIVIIIGLLFQTMFVIGQDMRFTQFYASPLYLNPAYTGANVCSRASLIYRNQWPGIKNTYQSYILSLDHYLSKQHVGIGLICGVDNAGTSGLRTTIINPSLGYEIKITKTLNVRLGLQPGVTIKSINFNQLLFGDQIARSGSPDGSITTIETPTQTRAFFDIGAGVLIYTPSFWAGASFFHLTKPNESFYENKKSALPIKYSVHGGNKFYLNADERDPELKRSISLVAHYSGQDEYDQFDLGVYYTQYIMTIGIWYRGIPGLKYYKTGYSNDDALGAVVGFKKERLSIGYSYDFTISSLQNLTQGAHEVTLSYQLCKPKQKVKRTLISCPKF